ncbi:MAG: hypothetical protein GX575_16985 [Candidatus Anammoximicrobium sp.]|nr:hypothetical protein [Candidatus Anammoximicrobium sp.]
MSAHQAMFFAFLTVLAGCGGKDELPLVNVEGQLTLDGKPLGLMSVRFLPEAGTPGAGAEALTEEDGSYSLTCVRPGALKAERGIVPGSYRVVVTEPPVAPAAPPPQEQTESQWPEPAVAPPAPKRQRESVIPLPYTRAETTALRIAVPPEGGPIDLALRSRP